MTAVELYNRIASHMRSTPLPGLSRDDVEGFLSRYQKHLVPLIQKQFDERCRLGRVVPDFQKNVGLVNVTELDIGPTSQAWAAQFTSGTTKLAVKARCHTGNPEIQEYTVHLYSDKLGRWLVFPGETWVWSTEEAIQRFVENHFTQTRWPDRESVDGSWTGAKDAAIQLFNDFAISIANGWDHTKPLSDEDHAELESARQERWDKHYSAWASGKRGKAPSAGTLPSQPGSPDARATEVSTTPSTSEAPPGRKESGSSTAPVATPWGGLRGEQLTPEAIREGTRVVTAEGLHGTVIKVTEMTSIVVGPRVTHQREKRLFFDVRLDSGRTELGAREVYAEAARPASIIPDVSFDGGRTYQDPLVAWRELKRDYDHIAYYTEKGGNARKPVNIREYERQAKESREAFLRKFAAFRIWRLKYPAALLGDPPSSGKGRHALTGPAEFSELHYRLLELESASDAPRWPGEIKTLKALPKDYATHLKPGDPILAWTTDGENWGPEEAVLKGIEGEQAILDDDSRTPLFYVRLAPGAPVELPRYTEQQYLVDLGGAMLTESGSRYPTRGAVARAVKEFLALHGLDVRTHVSSGSMVTGIDLRPGSSSWTPAQIERMSNLLGNLNARPDGASFEPWQREGAAWDPYADYAGKGPGLVVAPEHIPVFAPLLAAAMKDADQNLNRVGDAWLAKLRGRHTPSTGSAGSSYARNGATAEQRQDSAGGCREDAFDLTGFGHIRIVCGQAGRRDQWQNVYVNGQRYGFNGGRWARREVPPAAVLKAIRDRGITAFGGEPARGQSSGSITLEMLPSPSHLELALAGRRFTLDDEPIDVLELIEVNDFERADVDDILALEPGEVFQYGGGAAALFTLKRVDGAPASIHVDPVVQAVVHHGGLRSSLLSDITPELHAKARAIPGFLRPDGLTWLEAAKAHYGPDVPVVEGSPSLEVWSQDGSEGTDGYIELVHWGLEYSFPELSLEEEEQLEYLCPCKHTPAQASGGPVERERQ